MSTVVIHSITVAVLFTYLFYLPCDWFRYTKHEQQETTDRIEPILVPLNRICYYRDSLCVLWAPGERPLHGDHAECRCGGLGCERRREEERRRGDERKGNLCVVVRVVQVVTSRSGSGSGSGSMGISPPGGVRAVCMHACIALRACVHACVHASDLD